MTVQITKPALSLRSLLAKLASLRPAPERTTIWTAGNGTTTTFALPLGWRAENVFVNGALMRPGVGEDYTLTFDGFVERVVFAVAPTAVDVAIAAKREV